MATVQFQEQTEMYVGCSDNEHGMQVLLAGEVFDLPLKIITKPDGCQLGLFWFGMTDEADNSLVDAAAEELANRIDESIRVIVAPPSKKSNCLINKTIEKVREKRGVDGNPLFSIKLQGGRDPLVMDEIGVSTNYIPITAKDGEVRQLGVIREDMEFLQDMYPATYGTEALKEIMICDDVLSSGATYDAMEKLVMNAIGIPTVEGTQEYHPFSGAVVMREGDIPMEDPHYWVQHVFQAPVIVLN
jgi:hypothetical protein